jgi:hypothetical protein
MKTLSLFLIALISLVFIVPANGQRRRRGAEKQQPTTRQQNPAQTRIPSSNSGRREKRQTPIVPLVPCTLTLNQVPSLRGFAFGQTFSQIKARFAGTQIAVTGVNMPLTNQKPFFQQYVLYSNNAVLGNGTSPIEEAANSRYGGGGKSPSEYSLTPLPDPDKQEKYKDQSADTFKEVKEINLFFYGADNNPILYGYSITYERTLAFDSTKAVKEVYSERFSIPVDSWTPHSEDRNSFNDWDASCKGWRAYIATGVDYTGLYFFVVNTDIENNADALRKGDARKKTTETFKP